MRSGIGVWAQAGMPYCEVAAWAAGTTARRWHTRHGWWRWYMTRLAWGWRPGQDKPFEWVVPEAFAR